MALADSSRNLACNTLTSGSVRSESAAAGRENDATSNQTPLSSPSPPLPSFKNTEKLSAPARTCEEQVLALTEKERPGEREVGRREAEGKEEKEGSCCLSFPSFPPPPLAVPRPRAGTPARVLSSLLISTIFRGLTIQSGRKGAKGPAALAAMTRPDPSSFSLSWSFLFFLRRMRNPQGSSRGLLVETHGNLSACCHEETARTARS